MSGTLVDTLAVTDKDGNEREVEVYLREGIVAAWVSYGTEMPIVTSADIRYVADGEHLVHEVRPGEFHSEATGLLKVKPET